MNNIRQYTSILQNQHLLIFLVHQNSMPFFNVLGIVTY